MQTIQFKELVPVPIWQRDRYLASHLVVLITCLLILAGGLILEPAPHGARNTRIGNLELPPLCIFKTTFGLPCPGCGLVRSLVAAMHGKYNLSYLQHRLGLLTLAYILLQIVHKTWMILIPLGRKLAERTGYYIDRGIIPLMTLFFLNWILVLVSAYQSR